MEHLLYKLDTIKHKFERKALLFLLDYDAIAPVSHSPMLAILPIQTRRILQEFISAANCEIAVLSGRSATDLKQMVKLRNIIYIGNHGHEIKNDAKGYSFENTKEGRFALWQIFKVLCKVFSGLKEISVSDNKYTLSVQYKVVSLNYEKQIRAQVKAIAKEYINQKLVRITYEQNTINIIPVSSWNKLSAIEYIMTNFVNTTTTTTKDFFPICLAGNLSEEDWISPFNNHGLTVQVGKIRRPNARYYLEDIYEVQNFLGEILSMVAPKKPETEIYSKYARSK